MKAFEEDNEDAYLNSTWANNKNMKAEMHGIGNIRIRMDKGSHF